MSLKQMKIEPGFINRNLVIDKAIILGKLWHSGQLRKYTCVPYFDHCIEVAEAVQRSSYGSVEAVVAALLHDTLEDTKAQPAEIELFFGPKVLEFVLEVTDKSKLEDGNRAARKEIDRLHLAKASPTGKTIKLADLLSNTKSIAQYDPDFAKVYMVEKKLLLPHLAGGDEELFNLCSGIINEYFGEKV